MPIYSQLRLQGNAEKTTFQSQKVRENSGKCRYYAGFGFTRTCFQGRLNRLLGVERIELYQIWGEHVPIIGVLSECVFRFPIVCSVSKPEQLKGDWRRKSRPHPVTFRGGMGEMYESLFRARPIASNL